MREKILQAIRKFQIETYLVTEKTVEGAELYFIKKELDMRRICLLYTSRTFEIKPEYLVPIW